MNDDGVGGAMRRSQFATVPAPAPGHWHADVVRRKQRPRRQFGEHADDAAEAGYSHLAQGPAGASVQSRRCHVTAHHCQGTACSAAAFVIMPRP